MDKLKIALVGAGNRASGTYAPIIATLDDDLEFVAVCDVVEAMSSHRPYRPAKTTTDILKELKDGRGTKYDVSVVDVMLPMIEGGEFESVWNHRNSTNTAT